MTFPLIGNPDAPELVTASHQHGVRAARLMNGDLEFTLIEERCFDRRVADGEIVKSTLGHGWSRPFISVGDQHD